MAVPQAIDGARASTSNAAAFLEAEQISWELLNENVRKTSEEPPRVSVVDTIATVKGCSHDYAGQVYRRLVNEGHLPEMHTVPADTIRAFCTDGRGYRGPVVVATAPEIVQVLWALPGDSAFKRNSAEVVVRYLGGDPTLIDEVWRNRAAQEALSQGNIDHPARLFGEAVNARAQKRPHDATIEAMVQSAVETAVGRTADTFLKELQRTHPWDFSRANRSHNSLLDVGIIFEGDDLTHLDSDEHVVRITDFLQDRVTREAWRQHGGKLKNIFAIELKKAKLQESKETGLPPPIARTQGEYRIIYTEADTDLMVRVFNKCARRFEGIVARDAAALRAHRRQRSIHDYFTRLGIVWGGSVG